MALGPPKSPTTGTIRFREWSSLTVVNACSVAREQPRHEVGAIRRHLEERLVQEMEVPVLTPDVDDEGHRGTEACDVAEVLLGTDADVDAAGRTKPPDVLDEVGLVRDEVVGDVKRPGRFRQVLD